MRSVKQSVVIPIITVVVLIIIAAVVFVVISKLPKDSGMVHVEQEYLDGTLLDLGEWKGTLHNGNEFFTATLDDLDGFLDSLRKSGLYDERLEFECPYGYYSSIFYLVVDGRIFSLRVRENRISIIPLQNKYYDVYFKSQLVRIMWAPVDTFISQKTDSKTNKYLPSEWDAVVTLDDIKYLYSKIDDDMYETADDGIYVKCYVYNVDETSWELISIDKTDKNAIKIYEDESGKVLVDVLYP